MTDYCVVCGKDLARDVEWCGHMWNSDCGGACKEHCIEKQNKK